MSLKNSGLAAAVAALACTGCVPDDVAVRQEAWTFENDCAHDIVLRVASTDDRSAAELIGADIGKPVERLGGTLTLHGMLGETRSVVVFDANDDVLAEISVSGTDMFRFDGAPCELVDP